jgi:hypothetical protein
MAARPSWHKSDLAKAKVSTLQLIHPLVKYNACSVRRGRFYVSNILKQGCSEHKPFVFFVIYSAITVRIHRDSFIIAFFGLKERKILNTYTLKVKDNNEIN